MFVLHLMTIKKGIQILDYYLGEKTKHLQDLTEIESKNHSEEWTQIMKKNLESEIVTLKRIQAQIVPKCAHPKKDHDRMSNGVTYCMNCNMDL